MIGKLNPREKGVIESVEHFEEFLSGMSRGFFSRIFSYKCNRHDSNRKGEEVMYIGKGNDARVFRGDGPGRENLCGRLEIFQKPIIVLDFYGERCKISRIIFSLNVDVK